MERKNRYIALASAVGMLVLIFDGKVALQSAADGINLCITTLIPSLFPFIILSIFLTGALTGQALRPLQPIAAACKIPGGTESVLAVSLLGGYPVGAQTIALLYRQGQLEQTQAMRMLGFCNNAGPAFIFGVLGSLFSNKLVPWVLWAIQICSAVLVGILLPETAPIRNTHTAVQNRPVTNVLSKALHTMALICGWVILMRMILGFMEAWFLHSLPHALQVMISGFIELANGCIRLSEIECDGLRFLMASGVLSFGGICVTMQTFSIADGISMKLYLPAKLLQTSISLLLACIFQFLFPADLRFQYSLYLFLFTLMIVFILLFYQYSKKSIGIPLPVGV